MSKLIASLNRVLRFGYEGENNVTQIVFTYDESWLAYGNGEFKIRVLRNGDKEAYNATSVVDDREAMTLTMTVTDIELSKKGHGELQLVYICADSIKKSPIYRYNVNRAIDSEVVDPPEGSIIAEVEKSLAEIKDEIGSLTDLTTEDKTSLVSAINEVNAKEVEITVDSELSATSTNPLQNKVITGAFMDALDRLERDESQISDNAQNVSGLQSDVADMQIAIQNAKLKNVRDGAGEGAVEEGCLFDTTLRVSATGKYAHAEGSKTTASGIQSHAEGASTKASEFASHAEGDGTTASGIQSHAEGARTTASGSQSHAEGADTTASGSQSHAEGAATKAEGTYSHAEGGGTTAIGNNAHAEGSGTKAEGAKSHAEGGSTHAKSEYSHAEGNTTHAEGIQSHAEGSFTTASGNSSHAEGTSTKATGDYSHAEGAGTTAKGVQSHAEGVGTNATGAQSHTEGAGTTASGTQSHAEGTGTTASSDQSHAEGSGSKAEGTQSHAEGFGTTASGSCSHAEGYSSKASGDYSHASGLYTEAQGYAQTVIGRFNIPSGNPNNQTDDDELFIIGNGTGDDTQRSNAHTTSKGGIGWYQTDVKVGGTGHTNATISLVEMNTALAGKASTDTATQSANGLMSAEDKTKLDGLDNGISDVQINGISIVENDVANVPKAKALTLGVVKANGVYGVGIYESDGNLRLIYPNENQIKSGDSGLALTPSKQHSATFYGLAKAAGDTTQSASSNAVGTYTEEAKTAIRTMLGLQDVYEDYSSALTALGVTES